VPFAGQTGVVSIPWSIGVDLALVPTTGETALTALAGALSHLGDQVRCDPVSLCMVALATAGR